VLFRSYLGQYSSAGLRMPWLPCQGGYHSPAGETVQTSHHQASTPSSAIHPTQSSQRRGHVLSFAGHTSGKDQGTWDLVHRHSVDLYKTNQRPTITYTCYNVTCYFVAPCAQVKLLTFFWHFNFTNLSLAFSYYNLTLKGLNISYLSKKYYTHVCTSS
jgi:hypothetical protein